MNESFSDVRVFGELKTNEPVLPYFDSLSENTIKGFALCSTYGGRTANSEFEFLTANTMGFISPFSIPFQQYVLSPIYTLERHMDRLGYETFATHPSDKENWSREKVYPYLGFEDYTFIDQYDYKNYDLLHGAVSDSDLYRYIVDKYNSMGDEKEALQQYSCLQYNALFDKKSRSDIFFNLEN